MSRNYRGGGLVHINAYCVECDKTWDSKNAHGVAVQHHDKTGHEVHVEAGYVYIYGGPAKEKKNASG